MGTMAIAFALIVGIGIGFWLDRLSSSSQGDPTTPGLLPKDLVEESWYQFGKYTVQYKGRHQVGAFNMQYAFFAPAHKDRIDGLIALTPDEIKTLQPR